MAIGHSNSKMQKTTQRLPILFGLILLMVLSCKLGYGQVNWEPQRLNNTEHSARRDQLFKLISSMSIDSAFLLTADILKRADRGEVNKIEIIDSYNTAGIALFALGSNQFSTQYLEKALQLYKGAGYNSTAYLKNIYARLAAIRPNNLKEAPTKIYYYYKAREMCQELGICLNAAGMLNNIGLVYIDLGQLDSAEFKFNKAQDEYIECKLPFNEFELSLNNNLADVAFRKKEYQKAYDLYETNFKLANKPNKYMRLQDFQKRKVTSSMGMAKVLLKTNRPKEALAKLEAVEQNLKTLDFKRKAALNEQFLNIKANTKKALNDINGFYAVIMTKQKFVDSLSDARTSGQNLFIENLLELQLSNADEKLKARENELQANFDQKKLFFVLALSLVIIVALIIGLRLVITSKSVQQGKIERELADLALQNSELKEEKLQMKLKNKRQDLTELSAQLLIMRNLSKETKERLNEIKAMEHEDQLRELKNLTNLFSRNVNEGKIKNLLQQHLDEVNNDFYNKLEELAQGNLTKGELEVCALQKLKLEDKQIADLRGTTLNAVQVARYRIRKKLDLKKEEMLDIFLSNI